MRADEVPREDGSKEWESDGTLQRPSPKQPPLPGDLLRELLVAKVLKKAKERFEHREWDNNETDSQTADQKRAATQEHKRKATFDSVESPGRISQSGINHAFSGNAEGVFPEAKELKPVMMADDDRAAQILGPSIQHILSKLDALLKGLNIARASYALSRRRIPHKNQAANSTETSSAPARGRKRRRPRLQARSTSSPDGRPSPDSDAHSASSQHQPSAMSTSSAVSRTSSAAPVMQRSQSSYSKAFAPLDWSSVVGMASLTGWNPIIVKKAAERCSNLFEEGMAFRTFDERKSAPGEGGILNLIKPGNRQRFDMDKDADDYASDEPGKMTREEGDEMSGDLDVPEYLQPVEGRRYWRYRKKNKRRYRKKGSTTDAPDEKSRSSDTDEEEL